MFTGFYQWYGKNAQFPSLTVSLHLVHSLNHTANHVKNVAEPICTSVLHDPLTIVLCMSIFVLRISPNMFFGLDVTLPASPDPLSMHTWHSSPKLQLLLLHAVTLLYATFAAEVAFYRRPSRLPSNPKSLLRVTLRFSTVRAVRTFLGQGVDTDRAAGGDRGGGGLKKIGNRIDESSACHITVAHIT